LEEAGQEAGGCAGESWPIDSIAFGKIPLLATSLRLLPHGLECQFEKELARRAMPPCILNFHDDYRER
jgi:hypothetical protein